MELIKTKELGKKDLYLQYYQITGALQRPSWHNYSPASGCLAHNHFFTPIDNMIICDNIWGLPDLRSCFGLGDCTLGQFCSFFGLRFSQVCFLFGLSFNRFLSPFYSLTILLFLSMLPTSYSLERTCSFVSFFLDLISSRLSLFTSDLILIYLFISFFFISKDQGTLNSIRTIELQSNIILSNQIKLLALLMLLVF